MTTLGMWLTVIGLALFHFSLSLTFHANTHHTVPFTRRAINTPPGATLLRIIGAALFILGAVVLANAAWYWPLIIVTAGPVLAGASIMRHNRRVNRSESR